MSLSAPTATTAQVKLPSSGQVINYVKVGSGPRKVLLLPGALGTGAGDFPPQVDPASGLAASGDFTVLAWDPPGYGKSSPPTRYVRTNS